MRPVPKDRRLQAKASFNNCNLTKRWQFLQGKLDTRCTSTSPTGPWTRCCHISRGNNTVDEYEVSYNWQYVNMILNIICSLLILGALTRTAVCWRSFRLRRWCTGRSCCGGRPRGSSSTRRRETTPPSASSTSCRPSDRGPGKKDKDNKRSSELHEGQEIIMQRFPLQRQSVYA